MLRGLALLCLFLALTLACGTESGPTPENTSLADTGLGSPAPSGTAPAPTAGSPAQPLSSVGRPLVLSEAESRGLVHPGLRAAISDLSLLVGPDLGPIEIQRLEAATWPDAGLGCPELGKMYAAVLTPGLWLVLVHQGQEYDYRVEGERAVLCDQSFTNEPLEQQPLVGIWTRLAGLPTPRAEVAAAEMNGKIYVLGGLSAGATANEEYDIASDTWLSLAPIPTGVDHSAVVAHGGMLYLIGGFDGRWGPVSDVQVYDPQADTWFQKSGLPTPRGALGAAVVDGKIYAIGGVNGSGDVGTVEVYDPATDTWTSRSSMPTARDHIAVAVSQGRIYVAGGRLDSFARNLDANEAYDPNTDTWAELAPLPTARSGNAAATAADRVFVFGGEAPEGTFEANEAYNPGANTWVAMPTMPTARHGPGAVAFNDRVYVLAGGPEVGASESSLTEVFILLPGTEP